MPRGGRTRGTRIGNGAGHGPANGVAPAFSRDYQPASVALQGDTLIEKALTREEYIERLRQQLSRSLDVYERATAPDAPLTVQIQAMGQMENRVFGAAKQTLEVARDERTDEEIMEAVRAKQRRLGVEPG